MILVKHPLRIIKARGTGEVLDAPHNFLTQFANDLTREDPDTYVDAGDLDYPASIAFFNPNQNLQGVSLAQSKQIGTINLIRRLIKEPGPFLLVGYSLGGIIVTETIMILQRENRQDILEKIYGLVLVANPMRNEGDSFWKLDVPGHGLYGQHASWPRDIKVWEIANPVDGITCTAADSPLRTLNDTVDAFSFAAGGGWGEDILDRLKTARWQLWGRKWWENPVRVWQRWSEAIGLLDGYLHTDQHNGAYWRDGYMTLTLNSLLMTFTRTPLA